MLIPTFRASGSENDSSDYFSSWKTTFGVMKVKRSFFEGSFGIR